jgi:hypothetical protein
MLQLNCNGSLCLLAYIYLRLVIWGIIWEILERFQTYLFIYLYVGAYLAQYLFTKEN